MPIPFTVDESLPAGGGGVTSAAEVGHDRHGGTSERLREHIEWGRRLALRGVVAGVGPRCGRARQHARRARRPTLRRRLAAHDRAARGRARRGTARQRARTSCRRPCCVQASPGFQEGRAAPVRTASSNTAPGVVALDDARSELRPATRRTTLGAQWSAPSADYPAQTVRVRRHRRPPAGRRPATSPRPPPSPGSSPDLAISATKPLPVTGCSSPARSSPEPPT